MINQDLHDVIFVGLPGPTHHYGGLSADNVASGRNQGQASHPREAAKQALALARLLTSLGIATAILPPQLRPYLPALREHFSGSDEAVIAQAARENPALLERFSSSSAMWTANAATIAPGLDCADGLLHICVANLHTHPHRRIEAEATARVLRAIFAQVPDCVVHKPLSAARGQYDEGAANHMRLCARHGAVGLHVFAYGADGAEDAGGTARQTLSAAQEIASQAHVLHSLYVKQNPAAIRQGVFHNDVIAVSNEQVLLAHEAAYGNGRDDIAHIARVYGKLYPTQPLTRIIINEAQLSVEEAVQSYFFNSQIVTTGESMAIIAPLEVRECFGGKAAALMDAICRDPANPITQVHYIDLRQSMRNGGGPACLRLRVPMTDVQLAAMRKHVNVLADEALLAGLDRLIDAYYPETLRAQDLGDPALYHACQQLLQDMGALMQLSLSA